ncbi:MAG: hypothetical protein LBE13_12245 [Bacteroidales bacterium]|jgi:hypothetical protein|nr:hypothetical protein [Bacteroidales bacterium]
MKTFTAKIQKTSKNISTFGGIFFVNREFNQCGLGKLIQNNDFGWKHLPCSDMNDNTVYLILTAMIKIFYNYLIKKVSKLFTGLLPSARLKRFIFRFICVACTWVYQTRQWVLKLYSSKDYEKVFM